jgi:hypothetical protein
MVNREFWPLVDHCSEKSQAFLQAFAGNASGAVFQGAVADIE